MDAKEKESGLLLRREDRKHVVSRRRLLFLSILLYILHLFLQVLFPKRAGNLHRRYNLTSLALRPNPSLNAHWRAPSSENKMPITVLQLLCLSPPASILLRHYAPALSLGVISTPIVLFLALFVVKITWAVVIYPKFFSPLRHLPTPDDNAFFSGQTKRVFREAGGRPMRHWIETVKNDGLIAYSVWFRERVLVTDPKTLGEVLVTKVGFLCCCEM
jgi:hypothetical protein